MIWGWAQLAWHAAFGWMGVDMLIGFAAVAVAIFSGNIIVRFAIPDLRKWAIGVAVVAFTLTGAIAHGVKIGSDEIKRQWDAALAKEAGNGEAARDDAVRDVDDAGLGGMRDDPRNRDSWKQPVGK